MKKRYELPSFLEGMARVLDIFGTYDEPYHSKYREQVDVDPDVEALRSDWAVVGDDMWDALDEWAVVGDDMWDALDEWAGQNKDEI